MKDTQRIVLHEEALGPSPGSFGRDGYVDWLVVEVGYSKGQLSGNRGYSLHVRIQGRKQEAHMTSTLIGLGEGRGCWRAALQSERTATGASANRARNHGDVHRRSEGAPGREDRIRGGTGGAVTHYYRVDVPAILSLTVKGDAPLTVDEVQGKVRAILAVDDGVPVGLPDCDARVYDAIPEPDGSTLSGADADTAAHLAKVTAEWEDA